MEPAHGPPLHARVAAANRTVLQLANMLLVVVKQTTPHDDPGAHGMNRGQSTMNGGKLLRRTVGMTWQRVDRQTAC